MEMHIQWVSLLITDEKKNNMSVSYSLIAAISPVGGGAVYSCEYSVDVRMTGVH